jgi:hypothetical protein
MDFGARLVGYAEILAIVIMVLLAVGLAIWRYELHVVKHGRPGGTSIGDAIGNVIDVFDPGQTRASRDLKDQRNVGPVRKTPERDRDDPIQLNLDPDGNPTWVRIRRTR